MPRTIDHIEATHQHARQLRNAGKPIWSNSVNIRAIIRENQADVSPECIAEKSTQIARMLRRQLPACTFDVTHPGFDFNFDDAVVALEANSAASLKQDIEEGFDILEDFNGQLEVIYDWADKNRVWLGE